MSITWELSRDEAEMLVVLLEIIAIEDSPEIQLTKEKGSFWRAEGMAEDLRKLLGMPERK